MKIEKFEDLEVWKESMRLAVEIYEVFKMLSDYGFKDQVQRASVSVPSNIAEGYERNSNKEFIQYLFISKGSAGELRTQLYLAIELKLIPKDKGLQLLESSKKISAMLYKLIKTRKENF
ncbi:MAG: four helix bundle protein [Ignavibacteriaceae bacterium]|nr:four helix bundle protein [Ignavibacteriaceae bacterium]